MMPEEANAATLAYNAGTLGTREWLAATRSVFLRALDEELLIALRGSLTPEEVAERLKRSRDLG